MSLEFMKRFFMKPLLCFIAVLVCNAASAEERPARFELTPFAGYRIGGEFEDMDTGSELELDESSSFGLILNIKADYNTQWQIEYGHQSTELDVQGLFSDEPVLDIDHDYLQFGGTYLFPPDTAQPFISATIGASRLDPRETGFDTETFFSFSLGGGLRLRPRERIGVRLVARVFSIFVEDETDIFCRTGPGLNVCAIRSSGNLATQWEAFAGLTYRF